MCSDFQAPTKQAFLLTSQPTGCQVTVLGEVAVDAKKGFKQRGGKQAGGLQGCKGLGRGPGTPPPTGQAGRGLGHSLCLGSGASCLITSNVSE